MTLNDLLEVAEAARMRVAVPVSPRLNAEIDIDPRDAAQVDDLTFHYGGQRVTAVGILPTRDGPVLNVNLA